MRSVVAYTECLNMCVSMHAQECFLFFSRADQNTDSVSALDAHGTCDNIRMRLFVNHCKASVQIMCYNRIMC